MTIWMLWTLAMSTVVALSGAFVARVAGHIGAPRRFIWMAAMMFSVAASIVLPTRTPVRGSRAAPGEFPTTARAISEKRAGVSGTAAKLRASEFSAIVIPERIDAIVAAAWGLWSFVLLLALARSVAQLRRRASSWRTVDTEIGEVLVSDDTGPAVIGWFRPRIVIPAWTLQADALPRELLLTHEREHLRAGDTRLLLTAEVVRRLFPWNVLIGWMANRLRLAVETDCDARVVRKTGNAHAYGLMLLAVSERVGGGAALAAPLLAAKGDLERRIEVLGARRSKYPRTRASLYAVGATLLLTTVAWAPRPGFPVARSNTVAVDSSLVRVGYAMRKQGGRGFFIDGAGIDRSQPQFSQAIRIVPGMRVFPRGDGETNVIASARPEVNCVREFVDGVEWQETTPGDIDRFVRSSELIAIEAYQPTNVPSQFTGRDGAQCATLVAWTQAIRNRRG